jgi:hypothetical protein
MSPDLNEFATRWELGLIFAVGCLTGVAIGFCAALAW